uniref:MAM domain-containing protein n=1 Tax=Heterorhabditis bacteriophora TaxID=37862 RepID=A0A1I7X4X1_HETBA
MYKHIFSGDMKADAAHAGNHSSRKCSTFNKRRRSQYCFYKFKTSKTKPFLINFLLARKHYIHYAGFSIQDKCSILQASKDQNLDWKYIGRLSLNSVFLFAEGMALLVGCFKPLIMWVLISSYRISS